VDFFEKPEAFEPPPGTLVMCFTQSNTDPSRADDSDVCLASLLNAGAADGLVPPHFEDSRWTAVAEELFGR
jgi:hypothetical protein